MASACCASRMMPTAMVGYPPPCARARRKEPGSRGCAAPELRVAALEIPPRGTVDDVDAARLQLVRKGDRIIHVPAFDGAVDGRDAHEQRHLGRHFAAHRLDDFERQTHAARHGRHHTRHCACWRPATGTRPADSRAPCGSRWCRTRRQLRALQRPPRCRPLPCTPRWSIAVASASPWRPARRSGLPAASSCYRPSGLSSVSGPMPCIAV